MKRKLGPGPAEIRFFAIAKAERGVVLAATRWRRAWSLFNNSPKASPKQRKAGLWETLVAAEGNLARKVERYEAARKGKR